MKVWGALPGKEGQPAKDKGNMEWAVGKGNYKYQLQLGDQFQKTRTVIVMSISSLFCYKYVYVCICILIFKYICFLSLLSLYHGP